MKAKQTNIKENVSSSKVCLSNVFKVQKFIQGVIMEMQTNIIVAFNSNSNKVNELVKFIGEVYFNYMNKSIELAGKMKGEYKTKASGNYAKAVKKMDSKRIANVIESLVTVESISSDEVKKHVFLKNASVSDAYCVKLNLNNVNNKAYNGEFSDSFKYVWPTAPVFDIVCGPSEDSTFVEPDEAVKILFDGHKKLVSKFGMINVSEKQVKQVNK